MEATQFHTTNRTFERLKDAEYRSAFVASQINIGIPFQIRALLKSRDWTQGELAERAGMLQPRISALLTPGKVRPNIETLRRIAEAFDCGLQIRFVPFSELVRWSDEFDPENFSIPTFERELAARAEIVNREDALVAKLGDKPASITVTTFSSIHPDSIRIGPSSSTLSELRYGRND